MRRNTPELDDLVIELSGLSATINAFAIQFEDGAEKLPDHLNADALAFIEKALDRIVCDIDEIIKEQNRKMFLEVKKA